MMLSRSPRTLAAALLAAGALMGAVRAQSLNDLVLASVNDEPITRRQLIQRLIEYRGEESLEKMINRVLLTQAAQKAMVTVTDAETDLKLQELIRKFKSDQDYRQFLTRSRLKEEQLRDEIRATALIQKVALKEAPLKDEDLQQYDARLMTADDKATAEGWIKELDNGGNFAQIASQKCKDPQLRQVGGRLAPFLRIEMLDIAKAIDEQKLKPGAYTKTPFQIDAKTWGVAKLEAMIPAANVAAAEKERLAVAVTAFRVDQWLNAAREKAAIQRKPLSESVVAVVAGENITRPQLVRRLLAFNGEEALEQLANRTLLLQAAKAAGVTLPDADAEARFADARKAFAREDDYRRFLATSGLSEKQFKDEIRYQLLMERVALKESPITDDDLVRYDARIITCPSQKVAKEWVAELDKGEDFGKMASFRSQDPESRIVGGRLKPFLKIDLLDVWRAISEQKLKAGEYTRTPVLLTDNRWALIKLEGTFAPSLFTPREREQALGQVTKYRVTQWLGQARQRAKIAYPVPLAGRVIDGE
jgi:hypothetical protein